MAGHAIPEDIREFIIQHIHSIAQLEALLLLVHDARGFSLPECASRLYIAREECEAALQSLVSAQFIEAREGHYVFAPTDDETLRKVEKLAEVYRQQLIPVTKLVHTKQERVQKFADAFRLRKDP